MMQLEATIFKKMIAFRFQVQFVGFSFSFKMITD